MVPGIHAQVLSDAACREGCSASAWAASLIRDESECCACIPMTQLGPPLLVPFYWRHLDADALIYLALQLPSDWLEMQEVGSQSQRV